MSTEFKAKLHFKKWISTICPNLFNYQANTQLIIADRATTRCEVELCNDLLMASSCFALYERIFQ